MFGLISTILFAQAALANFSINDGSATCDGVAVTKSDVSNGALIDPTGGWADLPHFSACRETNWQGAFKLVRVGDDVVLAAEQYRPGSNTIHVCWNKAWYRSADGNWNQC
ncbi:hypothetical protein PYCC9005_000966 [Savitreella phatthalungensis]